MTTLASEQMLTINYLELFSDDIIEAILDQATINLKKNIKEHGRIRYQLLRTTSTFSNYIKFQLAFETYQLFQVCNDFKNIYIL